MINLETPKKFRAVHRSRPTRSPTTSCAANSRKYDLAEHEYPKELDLLASLIDGMSDSGAEPGRRCDRRPP